MAGSRKKEENTKGKQAAEKAAAQKSQQKKTSSRSAKDTAGRKSRSKQEVYEYEDEENTGELKGEVIIICSFAVAVLLFLSNFRLCGVVGSFLRSVQLGVFGTVGFAIPPLLFVGTCFSISNRGNRLAAVKLAASFAFIAALCCLFQLIFGSTYEGWTQYYTASSANGAGGGLVGGLLTKLLILAIGKAGAYIVVIVLFILSLVLITERSFVKLVRRGGNRISHYAKEDFDRRKETYERRRAERVQERPEKTDEAPAAKSRHLKGVNLGVTTLNIKAGQEEPAGGYDEGAYGGNSFTEEPYGEEPSMEDNLVKEAFVETPKPRPARKAREVRGKEKDVSSPADRFTGHIEMPYASQEGEEDALHTIRLQRDTRTLEEMALANCDALTGQEPVYSRPGKDTSWEGLPRDVSMPSAQVEPPDEHAGEEGVKEEGFPQNTPPVNIFNGGEEPSLRQEEPIAYETLSFEEDEDVPQEEAFDESDYLVRGTNEEPIKEPEPESPVQESPAPARRGDTLFVPEGEKQVVTSTGKVIESETALLEKRIESKRKEAQEKNGGLSTAGAKREMPVQAKKPYIPPSLELLKKGPKATGGFSEEEYKATAIKLQQTLKNFGVGVTVTNISCGPMVTRYELFPEQGVKVSRIVNLTDDIKLSLAAADIRIEAPIPGKSAVGIEVPNKENNTVYLRDLLESDLFRQHKSTLAFAVGKDIAGQVVVTDIAKMPHLLIAGATGSGKSVCINTIIMSLIYKSKPEDVRMIMIDPKVVELSVYNGIPHLLIPVVTDPKKASGALNWAVGEMMDRYKKFADCGVRDLKGYNARVAKVQAMDVENKPEKIPQLVLIVDELADLMMVAHNEVEDAICRLAQLARAAGIHLVIATQRPSVDVITGLIKANVPSRIAFAVKQGVDSRTILDMNGAERLLGKGDMLFYPSGFSRPLRVQGAFVADEEVSVVVDYLKKQGFEAGYNTEIEKKVSGSAAAESGSGDSRDELFWQAGAFIIEKEKASIGMLQRMYKIGFNRAARIMDQLAAAGVVGEEEGTKPRKILMTKQEFESFRQDN